MSQLDDIAAQFAVLTADRFYSDRVAALAASPLLRAMVKALEEAPCTRVEEQPHAPGPCQCRGCACRAVLAEPAGAGHTISAPRDAAAQAGPAPATPTKLVMQLRAVEMLIGEGYRATRLREEIDSELAARVEQARREGETERAHMDAFIISLVRQRHPDASDNMHMADAATLLGHDIAAARAGGRREAMESPEVFAAALDAACNKMAPEIAKARAEGVAAERNILTSIVREVAREPGGSWHAACGRILDRFAIYA